MITRKIIQNWCEQSGNEFNPESIKKFASFNKTKQVYCGYPYILTGSDMSRNAIAFTKVFTSALRYAIGDMNADVSAYTPLLAMFCNWANQYEIFEELNIPEQLRGMDPSKGFYIYGTPGNGKTTLMRAFALTMNQLNRNPCIPAQYCRTEMPYNPMFPMYNHGRVTGFNPVMVNASNIVSGYMSEGVDAIRPYSDIKDTMRPGDDRIDAVLTQNDKSMYYGGTSESFPALIIDDFGWDGNEDAYKHYGADWLVLTSVVKNRYDNDLVTFITSNFNPLSCEIDEAVIDRFRHMFNVVDMDSVIGESFRK